MYIYIYTYIYTFKYTNTFGYLFQNINIIYMWMSLRRFIYRYMFVRIHTYIWCRNAQISLTYTHILCIYVYTSAWCQVKIPPIHIHPTYTYRTISHTRTHISRKYVYIYFIARHKDSSPKNRQFIICHSVHMSLWWRLVWISIWKVT